MIVPALLAMMALPVVDLRTVRAALCQILVIDGDREGNRIPPTSTTRRPVRRRTTNAIA
jgi:hypothetical protein